jgi:hypothetical protein
VQHLRAEREQRRVAIGEIKAPCIDFHEASDERRRRLPLLSCELHGFGAQFVVGEIGEVRHVRL